MVLMYTNFRAYMIDIRFFVHSFVRFSLSQSALGRGDISEIQETFLLRRGQYVCRVHFRYTFVFQNKSIYLFYYIKAYITHEGTHLYTLKLLYY